MQLIERVYSIFYVFILKVAVVHSHNKCNMIYILLYLVNWQLPYILEL